MARWIGWAMQQNNGDVLVVCGGWHAPVLAKMWRECPQEINTPELPSLADAVTGCYLTPYSEKRLDVLAGYLSGMPAPVWQNWCWQWGLQQAGEQLLKTVLTRLRSTSCLLRPRIWLPLICMRWHWHSCAVIHYRYALTGWMP